MNRIVLRIEIEKREFTAKMLLAHKFLQAGNEVIITTRLFEDSVRFKRTDAVILNSLYENMSDNLTDLRQRVGFLYFMDEEALVIRSEEEYLKRLPASNMKKLDRVFALGPRHREMLARKYPGVHVNETGNPRISILDEQFSSVRQSDILKIKQLYGDFILVVSNFGTVNLKGSDVAKTARYRDKLDVFSSQGLVKTESDLQDFEARFEHYEEIFQSFLGAVEELAKIERNVVVRIHPAEDAEIWRARVYELDNVYINTDYDLNHVIAAASVVVQNGCTSALEANYLKVPCVSFRPVVNPSYDQEFPSLISHNVFDLDALIEYCREPLPVSDAKTILDSYVSFAASDDCPQRISEIIYADFNGASCKKSLPLNLANRLRGLLKLAFLKLFSVAYFSRFSRFVPERARLNILAHVSKCPSVNANTITDLLETFDMVYGSSLAKDVKVKKFGLGSFLLSLR